MEEKRKVVIFPLPLEGHMNPMLQLAEILYSKGFSIAVIHTEFNCLNPSNYPNFTFHSIPDGLSEEQISERDVAKLINLLNTRTDFVQAFRECMENLLAQGSEEDEAAVSDAVVCCLITDAHWHFAQGVAQRLGIRRIVVRTANISAFLAIVAVPNLHRNSVFPVPEAKLEDPLTDVPNLKVKDLPQIKTENQEKLYDHIDSMLHQTKASSALIFNSFQELELDSLLKCANLFSIPIFPVGPFHKQIPLTSNTSTLLTQDHTSIPWLDSKPPKSVLYVSFGSLVDITQHEFQEIACGLANTNLPFLWVVRPGMIHGGSGSSKWLESLPEGYIETVKQRGLIVKWAPQQQVLAHPAIGGFFTHCGWNSTLESICEGVLMLCYPCFGDQMANARYICDVWRVGVRLEGELERSMIEKGIRKLMLERENKGMAERIEGLKEKMNDCLKEGGSTFRSLDNLVKFILNISIRI